MTQINGGTVALTIASYPSAAAPANGVSAEAVMREVYDLMEKVAVKSAATIVNGQTLFTIAGGPIEILELYSYCATANDATASTLQYSSTPTLGSTKTISGASATLGSATAGTSVTLNATSLATAPDIVTGANGGVAIGANVANKIIVNAGTITAVVGVGSTTGTWSHHLRYRPLARGVTVT